MDHNAETQSVKYSFIVPVYNVEDYLPKCLDSLLGQTYRNFEIIVIDDGTKDRSGVIAEEYQKKYPKFMQVIHQENQGQGGARNNGIAHAKGTYVLFVDSDDYVRTDMLEVIDRYEEAESFDVLVFGNYTVSKNKQYPGNAFVAETPYITAKQHLISQPTVWNRVYRASIFRENSDLRFPKRIYYEDLSWAPCVSIYADKIRVIADPLYNYVQRETSTMHSRNVSRMLDIIPAFDFILDYFTAHGKKEEYDAELEWLAIQHVLFYSVHRILSVTYDPDALEKLVNYMDVHFPDYRNNPYLAELPPYMDGKVLQDMMDGKFRKLYATVFRKMRILQYIKRFVNQFLRK